MLATACVSVARAQDVPAPDPQPTAYLSLEGQPPAYRPYAPLSYFLWHDGAGWHLRATTSGHFHNFNGVIRAQEGVSDVRPLDPSISLQLAQNQIQFGFSVAGGEKGFDWQSPGAGCAQYNLMIDGQDRPGKVTVGYSQGHPNYGGFELCAGGEAEPPEVSAAMGPEVDPDGFRPALSPYGQWVDVPGYGLVWRPYASVVGPDFVPYSTEGHWVYTNAGWLWASGYPWGWAPFHYGNWVWAGGGWAWVPGRVWAPAWVEWRSGGGYIGWAPLAPAGYVGVTVVRAPVTYTYVQVNNFTAVNVQQHAVVGVQAQSIHAQTQPLPSATIVNGHPVAPVNAGPQPAVVSQATGHPISAVPVHSVGASVPPSATPGVHYAAGATAEHPVAVQALPPATARQYVTATRANGAVVPAAPATQGAREATPPSGVPATHSLSPAGTTPMSHGVSPAGTAPMPHGVSGVNPAAESVGHVGAPSTEPPAHSVAPATSEPVHTAPHEAAPPPKGQPVPHNVQPAKKPKPQGEHK
jgi:hypothetical protein